MLKESYLYEFVKSLNLRIESAYFYRSMSRFTRDNLYDKLRKAEKEIRGDEYKAERLLIEVRDTLKRRGY